MSDSLTLLAKKYANIGNVTVRKISPDSRLNKLTIFTDEALSYLPLRKDNVDSVYALIKRMTALEYPDYLISVVSDDKVLEALIPSCFRTDEKYSIPRFEITPNGFPLVKNTSSLSVPSNGLLNRHLAIWQSHGRFYNQTKQQWQWQRGRLFQTVEDLYTQSYVLPFLVPMLENAGANVLLPRERDTQLNEVIVDNDKIDDHSHFQTVDGKSAWEKGSFSGFADYKKTYNEGENPFKAGSFLQIISTQNSDSAATAEWIPDIPESGRYAVYVSYFSLPGSVLDAHYTVRHAGGETNFTVNQSMGGGTWIYLGHFDFKKGKEKKYGVFLSNYCTGSSGIVTADAVKFGGGMGNITRKRADLVQKIRTGRRHHKKTKTIVTRFGNSTTSGYPRYTEGSRYWLQWAGAPDSVYSRTEGKNDYSDDFQSRGFWVNYLAGGSSALPSEHGLKIPVDMAFAFHTDAGTTQNDSVIGTLGIFTVQNNDKKSYYKNGISRWNAREMTDIIQSQIVDDIRKTFSKEWIRRGLWNKSYSESRIPEVPSMLLELLSHQNFADIRFGLDPRFRFAVSRAIYKGMLRYLSLVNKSDYVVQPLPVEEFSTKFLSDSTVQLSWESVADSLEPTAMPDSYIVYTRMEDGGFDNGEMVKTTNLIKNIEKNKIYSFKVEAVNKGGKSFPSEILSVYKSPVNKPTVLIVNAFNRVSGPAAFTVDSTLAGFNDNWDAGVPYISDISFIGNQYEFRRGKPYRSDENPGYGASFTDFEDKEIGGNSFDYPYIHGQAIKAAGYSFVSCSEKAVLNSKVKLYQHEIVDLILGKERQVRSFSDSTKVDFKTFEPEMQKAIIQLTDSGKCLFISGSNIVSDMELSKQSTVWDLNFIEKTLKIKWMSDKINNIDKVGFNHSVLKYFTGINLSFYASPNPKTYFVEAPDVITPADNSTVQICTYNDNKMGAGIAYKGKYKVCAFGFPFENIKEDDNRNELMKNILRFFTEK